MTNAVQIVFFAAQTLSDLAAISQTTSPTLLSVAPNKLIDTLLSHTMLEEVYSPHSEIRIEIFNEIVQKLNSGAGSLNSVVQVVCARMPETVTSLITKVPMCFIFNFRLANAWLARSLVSL